MITNETRAKLIGRSRYWGARFDGPFFDTDANAVAELRAFVRARGEEIEFVTTLHRIIGDEAVADVGSNWAMLDATPQQQTAAFDAVFKLELERIQ